MRTYDTYKDSGIAWLGQIPSHWEVKRLGSFFNERRQKVSDKDFEPLSVTKLGIFPQWENVAKTNDGDNRKLVRKGDFVINSRSDRKGSSGVSELDGSVSLINIVLSPKETVVPAFCNYLLKCNSFIEEYYRIGRGIVADLWTTRYQEMKCMDIAMPPLAEQEAIVNYLTNATAKIDEAIAQQQKMIDLLKERKQIIINEAVTHGLDPNVPMKQTGIDWLPQIPALWEFVRIKNIASVKTGKTPPSEDKHYFDNGTVLWFTPADFDSSNIYLNESQRHITQKAISEKVAFLFPPNSVLMIGIGGTLGRIGFCKNSCFSNQQINAIIVNNNYNPIYLAYCLKSEFDYIWSRANTATMPIINQQATKDLLVTCPPFDEQEIIANEIEMKCLPLNEAISRHKRMITLLNERKQIVINDVVTGKIKVK